MHNCLANPDNPLSDKYTVEDEYDRVSDLPVDHAKL